jgi:hypothetical protein
MASMGMGKRSRTEVLTSEEAAGNTVEMVVRHVRERVGEERQRCQGTHIWLSSGKKILIWVRAGALGELE